MSRNRVRNMKNFYSGDGTLFSIRHGKIAVFKMMDQLRSLPEHKLSVGVKAFLENLPLALHTGPQVELLYEMKDHPERFITEHRFPNMLDILSRDLRWSTEKRHPQGREAIIYTPREIGGGEHENHTWRTFMGLSGKETMSRDYLDYCLTMIRRGRLTAAQIRAFKARVMKSNQENRTDLVNRAIWSMLLRIYTPPVDVSKWQKETEEKLFG